MILKVFKEKSIKKRINILLAERVVKPDNSAAKTLGVLINIDEFNDVAVFEKMAKEIKIQPNNFKIIGFSVNKKNELNAIGTCYYLEDFNRNGQVKNVELQSFLDYDFDILINYYAEDILELKLLSVLSKAKLKIGILQQDERINDLIIKTELKDFKVFKTELFKYLTILNKIN
ncbi:hypothetical protein JJL45_13025 [Tamlana sp. s12]|uniref:DUF6913 domain-containing protein n=1 Tax=Tamlana sp. s12 TaxID=1630406 RepID=UPI0007FF4F1B|nr:hypothetical protein [Tamlana sp. s12]OBQ56534.1 hypothetical protein VQ01_04075 [Tamlana sp. s12]QQY81833.1 hypothetical protein JJL45_13025 [Tamlana sp. s12]